MTQMLLILQLISLLLLFCGFLSYDLKISAAALESDSSENLHESKSSEEMKIDMNYGWKWNRNRRNKDEKNAFQCSSTFGIFADIQDCSFFYQCFFKKVFRHKCPSNYHFDMFRKKCLSPPLAVCDTGTGEQTTEAAVVSRTTKKDSFRCPSWFGHFPDEINCAIYYQCSLFMPVTHYCPEGTLYDVIRKKCWSEIDVNCGSRWRQTTLPSTTVEITTSKPTVQTTSTLSPKPTDPPETTCPPDDLDCIIKNTGDISKWFECPDGMGSHPHPNSTKLFIFCRNGKPTVKKCGQSRIFSTQTKTCIMSEKFYT